MERIKIFFILFLIGKVKSQNISKPYNTERYNVVGYNLMDKNVVPINVLILNNTFQCFGTCLRTVGCTSVNLKEVKTESYICRLLPKNPNATFTAFERVQGWIYAMLGAMAMIGKSCDPKNINPCYLGKCQQVPSTTRFTCVPFKSCEVAMENSFLSTIQLEMELPFPLLKLPVDCIRKNGKIWTGFRHNDGNQTITVETTGSYEAHGSYSRKLVYQANVSHIISVVDQMNLCLQHVHIDCVSMAFHREDYGWVEGRHSKKLSYFGNVSAPNTGCECGLTKSCADKDFNCNCDGNYLTMYSDKGYFMRKEDLPLFGIRLGDLGGYFEWAKFTIGNLFCHF